MSTTALRRFIDEPPAALRRFLILILGVVAIVIGLLAMHSFSATPAHGAHATSTTSTDAHAAVGHSGIDAGDEHCASDCNSHSAAAMMCILALLVGMLLIAIPRTSKTLHPIVPWLEGLASRPPSMRLLPPPSLHILSISRT
jgi:hypothetical protein